MFCHFTDEKTGLGKLNNPTKVTIPTYDVAGRLWNPSLFDDKEGENTPPTHTPTGLKVKCK